jgi:uncharacterized membrane-anchored protein YhcB (DUF1043 family)
MNKALVLVLLIIGVIIVKFVFADAKQQEGDVEKQLIQLNAKLDAIVQAQAKLDTIIAKQDQTMEMLRMRRLHASI